MTVVIFKNEESVSNTTDTNWSSKLSASGTLGDGDYIVWTYCEYAGSDVTKPVAVQVLINGVQRGYEQGLSSTVNGAMAYSTMGLINLSAGSHTVEIQFKNLQASSTCYCQRARILVMKH